MPVKVPLDTVAQGQWLRDCDIEGVRVIHQPLKDIVPDPTPDPDGCVEAHVTGVVTQDDEVTLPLEGDVWECGTPDELIRHEGLSGVGRSVSGRSARRVQEVGRRHRALPRRAG